MCECGCVLSDERYKFPGPDGTFYVLTLRAGCVECDGPPAIAIEQVKPGDLLFGFYSEPENIDGALDLADWRDSRGVAITTGPLKREFVKSALRHLVGIDSTDFSDEDSGNRTIDECGAEAILEEMYADVTFRPALVTANSEKE